jgi:hypothetical protein
MCNVGRLASQLRHSRSNNADYVVSIDHQIESVWILLKETIPIRPHSQSKVWFHIGLIILGGPPLKRTTEDSLRVVKIGQSTVRTISPSYTH